MAVLIRLTRRAPTLIVAAALAVTVAGLAVGTGALDVGGLDNGMTPGVGTLAAACTVAALAAFVRLPVRIDGSSVELTWGEAAVVVLLHTLPAGWVPAAVLVGVAGAQTARGLADQRRTTGVILRTAATLTLAATAAAVVAYAVDPPYGRPLTLRIALGLIAGALVYASVTMYLLAVQSAGSHGPGVPVLLRRMMRGKLLMLVGNITVGLLAVAVQLANVQWLLLPPLVWLLHQTYAYRLRLDDERRTWQVFSTITGELNRLDEHDTAAAGINGALRLFPAAAAEVVVGMDGRARAYAGERNGPVSQVPDAEVIPPRRVPEAAPPRPTRCPETEPRDVAGWPDDGTDPIAALDQISLPHWRRVRSVERHPLLVGGLQVGELRLRIEPRGRFTRRDRLMLAAYGDALAAALHDAATHQELRSIVDRSSYEAVHDPLTGMVNRGALLTQGDAALQELPAHAPVALLLLDVNHFKEVNNALGHAAGDDLLRVIALRLGAAVRSGEIIARLGGDEFALLLTGLVDGPAAVMDGPAGPVDGLAAVMDGSAALDAAVARARRLAEQVAAPTEVSGVALSVEASVGVVTAAAGDTDMTELLRRADIAMYQAKRRTRGVAWYEPAADEASIDRLALLAELREALVVRDQLTVVLQPVVSLETGRPVGVEALVRWRHPRRGWLEPDEFLDAVENSELVGVFTRYVIDLALEIVAGWIALGIDTPIAVNLSARSLLDRTLADELPELLSRRGVPPDRLTLEITENVVLSERAVVVEDVLAALRATGVRIAVDGFGSGFSSLTFLTRVPVDEVKIDREFVARMVESAEAAAIVRTTVDLGRELGLRVVAEGVESSAQRLALAAVGCVAAQGYHFYRPLPPERAVAVLIGSRGERNRDNVRRLRAEGTG